MREGRPGRTLATSSRKKRQWLVNSFGRFQPTSSELPESFQKPSELLHTFPLTKFAPTPLEAPESFSHHKNRLSGSIHLRASSKRLRGVWGAAPPLRLFGADTYHQPAWFISGVSRRPRRPRECLKCCPSRVPAAERRERSDWSAERTTLDGQTKASYWRRWPGATHRR